MASDGVGSGETLGGDDRPDAVPAEPAVPAEAPEYADPVEAPDDDQADGAVDNRDNNLEDFEPDEDEPAGSIGVVRTEQEDSSQRQDSISRTESDLGRPERDESEDELDDADGAATQARQEAEQQHTDADGRQHYDLPSETVGRTGDRSAASEQDQADRQHGADPAPDRASPDAEPVEIDHSDPAEVYGDVERAHRDVMGDVERARQSVRDMVEQANRDIDELIRSGRIHDIPDGPENVEEADIPDVDWDGPEGQGWDVPDSQDRPPDWEDWDGDSDDRQPDNWSPDVNWDHVPDDDTEEDDYLDIPYMTRDAVAARTHDSMERNHKLVSRDEPIRATDYSQEIRPLDEMPQGGAVHIGLKQMHVLRADSAEQFATDWHAHIEREQAAKYDHRFAQDARPISSQGMKDLAKATLGKEFDGDHYFQQAVAAVQNGRCDPDQLRTVLNELHPELRHQYGMYQPGAWRNLPYIKDSVLEPKESRQVTQARQAVDGYARSLPDGHRYEGKKGTAVHTGAVRLRAEIDLYLRTRDPNAPRAIQEARLHRLASASERPKVLYDRYEDKRGSVHQQIPREFHDIYHRARIADPRARIFRLYR